MNFKIENNYLNIINYPSIEKHFEEMASQGWLIKKVIFENIFIYKRIEPEDLDFSISLYEVETGFTKKIKIELKEFQSVCETVGWNYATKSRNLYICFKEKGSEVIDLETDDEEKFNKIEKVAKKQLIGAYIGIIMLILSSWFILLGFVTYVDFMQNGLIQAVILLVPIFIILSISQILRIKRFLKANRENMEKGKTIEYSKSKFYIKKAMFFSSFILAAILIIYLIYVGVILKNSITLFFILYIFVSIITYSIIEIPSRVISEDNKKRRIFETIMFIITIGLIVFTTKVYIPNLLVLVEKYNDLDVEEFRVLSPDKALNKDGDKEARIYQNVSLLVSKSYKYSYFDSDKKTYIDTEYSNTLNENIAKIVVEMYKSQSKRRLKQYKWNLEIAIEEDNYRAYEELYKDDFENDQENFPEEKGLEELGLSLEEFNKIDKSIKNRAVKECIKLLESKAIIKDKENLWNLEEVYFLNHGKTEVVIREGKEVFYLEGKDFSDPKVVKTSKNRLNL